MLSVVSVKVEVKIIYGVWWCLQEATWTADKASGRGQTPVELESVDNDNHNGASGILSQDVFVQCTYILLLRFCLNIRAKCLYYQYCKRPWENRGVLNSRVLVAIKSQFWVLITTLFKNTRTLKFKSCLRNCVFGCCQHITITSNEPTKRLLFRKRSAKMIDGSEKRKRQLAFEFTCFWKVQ